MDKLKELLGEELFNQVVSKLGTTKIDIINNGEWIPKEKFNSLNDDLKDLKKQISDRDKQLEDLTDKAKGQEDLVNEINNLKETNKQIKTEYENKIAEKEFNYALENELKGTKAKNIRALKSLLDMDKISFNEGKLSGLEEQIKNIKTTDSYLFEVDNIQGKNPNMMGQSGIANNPFSKEHFNMTEQGKLLRENPTLAKQMMEQAQK